MFKLAQVGGNFVIEVSPNLINIFLKSELYEMEGTVPGSSELLILGSDHTQNVPPLGGNAKDYW